MEPLSPRNATIDAAMAAALFDAAVARWAAARRVRAPTFARETFGVRGALRLHRHAVGRDLYRAPANAAIGIAALAREGVAGGLSLAGRKTSAAALRRPRLFLETDVGRAVEQQVTRDFLGLPGPDGEDAIWREMLADARVAASMEALMATIAERRHDPGLQARIADAAAAYVDERAAASEIAANLSLAAAGYAAFQQLTPGAIALSGPTASAIATHFAIQSFWAGPWAGALWHAMAPVAATPALTAATFAGLMLPAAMLAAFAGVAVDPALEKLGVHRQRLIRLTDTIESNLTGRDARFPARGVYIARLFDLLDFAQAAARAARA